MSIATFFVVCFILLSGINILSVLCAVLRALVGWGRGGMEAALRTSGIDEPSSQQFGESPLQSTTFSKTKICQLMQDYNHIRKVQYWCFFFLFIS